MKTKISMQQPIRKYLRELSVVVIGIAITLGINNWINHRNSKKDLEQYLNTIKLELKTNIEQIENEINSLNESVSYTHYLLSENKESLDADTIQEYGFAITHIRDFILKDNAFEMFKSSSSMRLISDKELQLSIWEAYSQIEDFQSEFLAYYQYKKDKMYQEIELKLSGKTTTILMYDFFITGYALNLQERCKKKLKILKETVTIVEKTL